MTPFRRWCVVAVGTLLLVGAPVALRVLPAADSDVSAGGCWIRCAPREGHAWSGYVETDGTLQLPDADRFSDVGALFGERTRMRVWWRDDDHWRVDQLCSPARPTWSTRATRPCAGTTSTWTPRSAGTRTSGCRAPPTCVPPVLAERLLRGVGEDDVTAGPGPAGGRRERARAAGGAGLRRCRASTTPTCGSTRTPAYRSASRCTPPGAGTAAFTSEFRDFSSDRPDSASVGFDPPAGVDVSSTTCSTSPTPPTSTPRSVRPTPWPGSPKAASSDRAVGVYGTRDDPGDRHPAPRPRGGRPARPARDHAAASTRTADGRRSPSGRSGWCSPARRATAGGCWPGR